MNKFLTNTNAGVLSRRIQSCYQPQIFTVKHDRKRQIPEDDERTPGIIQMNGKTKELSFSKSRLVKEGHVLEELPFNN